MSITTNRVSLLPTFSPGTSTTLTINVEKTLNFGWIWKLNGCWTMTLDDQRWANVDATLIQRWINVDARFNQRWIFSIFCSNITSLYSVIQTYFMVRNSLQLCWQKNTKKETWFLTTLQESRIKKRQQWKWTKFLNTRPHPMQIKTWVTGVDCHWKRCG